MKRVYWLVPCIATTLFAAYYSGWSKQQEIIGCDRPRIPRDPFAEYDGRNGQREAETDIAQGTPKYLTYGLPAPWIGEFGEILKRDYNVKQRVVAGCVVSESLVKYVDAYNAVIDRHLKARYGSDVMDVVVRKAEALYAERHPSSTSQTP